MANQYLLPAERVHYVWDATLPPVLEIGTGDTVVVDTRVLTEDQLLPGADAASILEIDWARVHALTGPVRLRDAQPGHTLEIRVKSLKTGSWGISWIDPSYGLLMDEFDNPAIRFFDLTRPDRKVSYGDSILIPLSPFLGVMGVAPATGRHTTYAPGAFGGNIDCKDIIAGTTLFLPIFVEGALFSTGDGHAVQGDGEICSAIECPMTAHLEFHLRSDVALSDPRVETHDHLITIGHADTLLDAVRAATRSMIAWLQSDFGLSRDDAYIVCSLAGDPRINEVVNGNPVVYGARYVVPRSIFSNS